MKNEVDKFAELERIFGTRRSIIGMIHLASLPVSPLYDGGGLEPIIERALSDARMLQEGGVDALEIENFSDPTYFPGEVGPELVAAMAVIADHVYRAVDIPIGICVLADPSRGSTPPIEDRYRLGHSKKGNAWRYGLLGRGAADSARFRGGCSGYHRGRGCL
ncbi:MAG: hypothetical protein IMY83_05620 [Chloroflexi bacterium]|nr:hypothetical protein [Chloroflexota bacterium]